MMTVDPQVVRPKSVHGDKQDRSRPGRLLPVPRAHTHTQAQAHCYGYH